LNQRADVQNQGPRRPPFVAIGIGAAVGVLGIWWFVRSERPAPQPAPIVKVSASAAPQQAPERPRGALLIDFTAPGSAVTHLEGVGAAEVVGQSRVARITGKSATAELELWPQPEAVIVSLIVQTTEAHDQKLSVKVNGKAAGSFAVGVDLTTLRFEVPASAWVGGRNRIELAGDGPEGSLVLVHAWLAPAEATVDLDLGDPQVQRAVGGGWTESAVIAGRSALRIASSPASVTAKLNPLQNDYALALVARDLSADPSELGLKVNGASVGKATVLPEWQSHVSIVPRAQLHAGENSVELETAFANRVAVDRVVLTPTSNELFLDIGDASARPYIVDGFSGDEGGPGQNTSWSDAANSRLAVPLNPAAGAYRLSIRGGAFQAVTPLSVQLRINDQLVRSFEVTADFVTRDVVIPSGRLVRGVNLLEFRYSATAKPHASNPKSGDMRDLALRYDWIELTPLPAG
jgi:hypothetical protein